MILALEKIALAIIAVLSAIIGNGEDSVKIFLKSKDGDIMTIKKRFENNSIAQLIFDDCRDYIDDDDYLIKELKHYVETGRLDLTRVQEIEITEGWYSYEDDNGNFRWNSETDKRECQQI